MSNVYLFKLIGCVIFKVQNHSMNVGKLKASDNFNHLV